MKHFLLSSTARLLTSTHLMTHHCHAHPHTRHYTTSITQTHSHLTPTYVWHTIHPQRNRYYIAESTKFDDLPTLVEYYVRHPAIFFGNLADGAEYHGEQLQAPFSVVEEQFYA